LKFFGFVIKREDEGDEKTAPSFVSKENDDGALAVAPGGAYGTYIDLDASIRSEAQLINKYREMAMHQEVDSAIDDIVNQAIVQDPDIKSVTVNLDNTKFSDNIKEKIRIEFEYIQGLLDFNANSYEWFRRWYIDGRLYFHVVIDPSKPKDGIRELRYIDPRKIRKVREIKKTNPDSKTAISLIDFEQEYYIFNSKGFGKITGNASIQGSSDGIKIAKDSIIYVSSGLLDKSHTSVISYLHKAIKPLNNLRALEDSVVIYRISRAPERRIFYIDVGNLPKMKAEQYMHDIMTKFKNRIVYDAATGEIRDDRKFMTMLEDFWLPRREGGRGTEISTLPAGQNLDQLEDVRYFQKQLYKSLNIPSARLESEQIFSLGRGAEISRDEDKFADFITRLRLRFSALFIQSLEKQLILKNIITPQEWDANVENIKIRYAKNSYYTEIRENEIMNMRLETLTEITDFVGVYFSREWVQKNILRMTEDEIVSMESEINNELMDNENRTLDKELSDLRVQTVVHKQAQKDGIVIDPGSGEVLPPQMLKPDATIKRD
jgi:Bacteriophage T4-like portal protein (Gp20)